jgi:hypothetical protein
MSQEIPSTKTCILPNSAHMLNMERPDAFNHAVIHFLQEK